MSEIQFFGDVDKTRDGKISSEMPAWFFDVQIENLEEGLARKKRSLSNGEIPPENVQMVRNEVEGEEQRLKAIKNSKPVLNTKQKDLVGKEYNLLEQQIKATMPTVRDDKRGFVNPRDELKRLQSPHIKISKAMADACGVARSKKGEITGNQAAKCYKMMGKVLGENTNVERIRKEGTSQSYRTMEDLTRQVLGQFSKGN